jgi:hypothetical protein
MPQPQPHTESTIETRDDALEALQRSWPTFVIERRSVLGSELHYQALLYHCLRARMHTDRRCHHIAEASLWSLVRGDVRMWSKVADSGPAALGPAVVHRQVDSGAEGSGNRFEFG